MTTAKDARGWLRMNGHAEIAAQIDAVMAAWRERQAKTRRNWWDVLAGDRVGNPHQVEGITFPVLAVARRRKGWPQCESEIGSLSAAPDPTSNERIERSTLPQEETSGVTVEVGPERKTRHKRTRQNENANSSFGATKILRGSQPTLTVRNFAQLEKITLPLTDLVVMVGPQATGKILVLEPLKLAIDRNRIVRALKQHGFKWEKPEDFAGFLLRRRIRE